MTQVTAAQVVVNLPKATAPPERRGLAKGAVGDFVFVDCERVKLLGRIVETKIPDGERLSVEPKLGKMADPDPIGRVQLLAAVEQGANQLVRGIPEFPRIGDGVFLAEASLLATMALGRPCRFMARLMNFRAAALSRSFEAKDSSTSPSVIDRSPEVVHLAVDLHVDLVEVPAPVGEGPHAVDPLPADLGGEQRAKPVPPIAYRLIADVDTALGQQAVQAVSMLPRFEHFPRCMAKFQPQRSLSG